MMTRRVFLGMAGVAGTILAAYASMGIRIEVIATRDRGHQEVKVTEGLFTFVALDQNHRPRPLPAVD